jgi:hypothetical protein
MISKELNAALSDEKQRERWLKRVLPGLAITIVYFVFVSGTLTDKANKAELDYKALRNKGIAEEGLKASQQQYSTLQSDLADLKKRDDEVQKGLSAKAGFLYGENSMNEAVGQIAQLIDNHQLRLIEAHVVGSKKLSELPRSYADLKKWLDLMLKNGDTVHIHRFSFMGRYVNVYEMLKEMALSEITAMPVFLSMKNPETNDAGNVGLKVWTLDLWI